MNELNHKTNKGHWFKVDNLLIDTYAKELGIIACGIYFSIKRHANAEGVSWPSYKLISEELYISERTVIRHIGKLEKYGLIDRNKNRRKGQWDHNIYFITERESWITPDDFKSNIKTISHRPDDNKDKSYTTRSHIKNTNIKKTHIINTKEEGTNSPREKENIDRIKAEIRASFRIKKPLLKAKNKDP